MKNFALAVAVMAFGALMVAGCPDNSSNKANKGGCAPAGNSCTPCGNK